MDGWIYFERMNKYKKIWGFRQASKAKKNLSSQYVLKLTLINVKTMFFRLKWHLRVKISVINVVITLSWTLSVSNICFEITLCVLSVKINKKPHYFHVEIRHTNYYFLSIPSCKCIEEIFIFSHLLCSIYW
jgi:hypothetical protein